MTAQNVSRIGRHVVSFEEPDTVVYRLDGRMSEPQAREVVRVHRAWAERKAYCLILCDMRTYGGADAHARRVLADLSRVLPKRAIACFGTSFSLRIAADLLMRAMRLVGRGEMGWAYFDEEDSARAWLRMQGELIARQVAIEVG